MFSVNLESFIANLIEFIDCDLLCIYSFRKNTHYYKSQIVAFRYFISKLLHAEEWSLSLFVCHSYAKFYSLISSIIFYNSCT